MFNLDAPPPLIIMTFQSKPVKFVNRSDLTNNMSTVFFSTYPLGDNEDSSDGAQEKVLFGFKYVF